VKTNSNAMLFILACLVPIFMQRQLLAIMLNNVSQGRISTLVFLITYAMLFLGSAAALLAFGIQKRDITPFARAILCFLTILGGIGVGQWSIYARNEDLARESLHLMK